MVVLDTDHMSLLQRGGAEGQRIRRRLRAVPPDDVAITVISYEEQRAAGSLALRGRLRRSVKYLATAKSKTCCGIIAASPYWILTLLPPPNSSGFAP